jgi:type VI secretion system secreted protein VgrG
VSSAWAGKNWGFVTIPRIGQEVVVDFLEGDPDRPLITGRVYNDEQMPPYTLPGNQTQSGLKSRSSKGGATETFNELRFEDKKGSEEIYLHAEKDMQTIVENNEVVRIGLVKKDPGTQTITVHGDQTLTINEGDQTETIKKGDQTLEVSKGKQTITVHGNQELTIKSGNQSINVKMGNRTTKVAMGKSSEEAMQAIELKVGQSSIVIDQKGVTIKGMMIKVEGQVQTQIKGMMTQVNGDAMLQMKGGITMIN